MTTAGGAGTPLPDAGRSQPSGCGDDLGWCLATTLRTFGQWAAASVTDLPGGPRGHLVLSTISRDLPSSQLALANRLGVDRTVMTYLLDDLEHAGLVERRPDPADRRARQVLITDAGRAALADCGARLRQVEDRLLAALAPHEATAFRDMIGRVARAAQVPSGTSSGDACTVAAEAAEAVEAACSVAIDGAR